METSTNNGVSCPHCKSSNVIVHKRGYSLLLGILGMVAFFFIYATYWIISSDYGHQNETVQAIMFQAAKSELIFAALLGLLCGFLGKNELRGKCLNCRKSFKV